MFSLTTVNTGQGLVFHPQRQSGAPKSTKYRCAFRVANIPRERMLDDAALWMMLEQHNASSGSGMHRSDVHYEIVLPFLARKVRCRCTCAPPVASG